MRENPTVLDVVTMRRAMESLAEARIIREAEAEYDRTHPAIVLPAPFAWWQGCRVCRGERSISALAGKVRENMDRYASCRRMVERAMDAPDEATEIDGFDEAESDAPIPVLIVYIAPECNVSVAYLPAAAAEDEDKPDRLLPWALPLAGAMITGTLCALRGDHVPVTWALWAVVAWAVYSIGRWCADLWRDWAAFCAALDADELIF